MLLRVVELRRVHGEGRPGAALPERVQLLLVRGPSPGHHRHQHRVAQLEGCRNLARGLGARGAVRGASTAAAAAQLRGAPERRWREELAAVAEHRAAARVERAADEGRPRAQSGHALHDVHELEGEKGDRRKQ